MCRGKHSVAWTSLDTCHHLDASQILTTTTSLVTIGSCGGGCLVFMIYMLGCFRIYIVVMNLKVIIMPHLNLYMHYIYYFNAVSMMSIF